LHDLTTTHSHNYFTEMYIVIIINIEID